MGRHRSSFKKSLDPKAFLFALSRVFTFGLPVFRRAISFFPERSWPGPDRLVSLHRSVHMYAFCRAEYSSERARVFVNNVDVRSTSVWDDELSTERVVEIISNVIVPGSRPAAIDPLTGTQLSSDRFGSIDWSTARPSLSSLTTKRLNEDLTFVVPKLSHFGHLLTDVLLPMFFAISAAGLKCGDRLNVVTSEKTVALTTAFVEALRSAGLIVNHVKAKAHQTIHVPRMLYSSAHTSNKELRFAHPECLDFARRHLLMALTRPPGDLPKRIYLRRGKTRTRRVIGEEELIEKLQPLGFVCFEGQWSNLAEQIAIFEQAEMVVTVHGAGMANILWSNSGATLVEISAGNARKSTGLHWASSVGARYHAIFGSDETTFQDFSIDPDVAYDEIAALLVSRSVVI